MPIPVEAMAGFPDGVPRAKGMDRRAFLRTGVLGLASVYAASKIDWTRAYEAAVAEAASPANQVVMLYLNGGNDGLNTIVPISDFAAYNAARPNLARGQGPSVVGGKVGSTVMPGTGGAHAWANVGVSGVGNNGDTKGFDTLWGDGSGGPALGPRGLARGRLHPGQPLPLRQPRLLVRRGAAEDDHRVAGPLAGPLRLAGQPAAGRLDRLEHLEADPRRARAGQRRPQPQRGRVPGRRRGHQPRQHHRADGARRGGPGRQGQRRPGPLPRDLRPHRAGVALAAHAGRARPSPPATRSPTSPPACSSRRSCSRRTSG